MGASLEPNRSDSRHRIGLVVRGCVGKSGRPQIWLLMGDDVSQDLIQAAAWPKSDQPPDLGDVWDSARHVLETFVVRFPVGNVDDRGGRVSQTFDPSSQLCDRHFLA